MGNGLNEGDARRSVKERKTSPRYVSGIPFELRLSTDVNQVVVIGAGQSGLEVAARLKYLGVKTLIIEKKPRVRDLWRTRYESLCLHDTVCKLLFSFAGHRVLTTPTRVRPYAISSVRVINSLSISCLLTILKLPNDVASLRTSTQARRLARALRRNARARCLALLQHHLACPGPTDLEMDARGRSRG